MTSPRRSLALITGASGGLGRAIAQVVAQRGWDLLLTARSQGALESLAGTLRERHGISATVAVNDLATPRGVEGVVRTLDALERPLDLLVNNAGLGLHGPYLETDPEREIELLRVNIEASVRLTRAVLPAMVDRGSGRILNVSSTAAFAPGPLMTTYYASKAFVLSYSDALAEELRGTGIGITTLCPGPTKTAFLARAGADEMAASDAMAAAAVARAGVDGVLAGRRRVIPGAGNTLAVWAARWLPRDAVIRWVARMQRRRRTD